MAKKIFWARHRKSKSAGWRVIGTHRCYFKNAWESNFARILQRRQEAGEIWRWEYEPDTFWFEGIKRGVTSYLPDFKVWVNCHKPEQHYYVEVKGWLDPKSKTKISRMAKFHPNVKLELVGSVEYRELQGIYGPLIPDWEK